ncbi:DUF4259 domain-containing protein [Streptomyces sp. NPDC004728]|uniref:DUF4259 domain-containing protein n=1 Tax=Streptomyces sp. NPDC004728 TaxID=3154289 RepID=UPI0033A1CEA8
MPASGRAGFALLRKRVLLSSWRPLSVVGARITARQRAQYTMGTWDIGPFENDMTADLAYTLDETAQDKREERVRATLIRTIQALDHLKSPEGAEAVAAAALIAAQCPGGPRPRVWWPRAPRPATARCWAAPGAAPCPKRCQEDAAVGSARWARKA